MKIPFSLTFTALICFLAISAGAQTKDSDATVNMGDEIAKIFNTEVAMDIDTTLFDSKQSNFYFSEASRAMIMTMVVPQSFEKAEEHFEKESKKKDYKSLERKKLVHNGKNILFEKGMIKKSGQKAFMYLYAVECTAESTIFVTGMHMDGDEKKFFPAIERAALSARLTGKKQTGE